MTNSPYIRSALAQAGLVLAPPLVQETLLDDASFRDEYGLKLEAVLSFDNSGPNIKRSNLFAGIRRVLSEHMTTDVFDVEDQKWELRNISKPEELPRIVLAGNLQKEIYLPDISALSPHQETRLRYLDGAATDVNLPVRSRAAWHAILEQRALEDFEFDAFIYDLRDTPIHKARSIREEVLARQETGISTFVPASRKYYERIIGMYDGSASILDYAKNTTKNILRELSTWRPYDGFLSSLLLSSHAAITEEIDVHQLTSEDILKAFKFIEDYGDRISQLGAIEVGLRIIPSHLELEPVIIRLIKQIRDDDPDNKTSSFKLLSGLFFLVDGELSRTRLFSTEPPFYRRLASLSQTALIHRQLRGTAIDPTLFLGWAFHNRGEQFYIQSSVDMRLEPRWNPDYGAPAQIKADFVGRIMLATRKWEQNLKNSELLDLVFGPQPDSLQSLSDSFHPFLPGPLEGAEQSQPTLPDKWAQEIEKQLDTKEINPSSFTLLVNSALLFRPGTRQAELAVKALKLGNYQLTNLRDKSELLAILNGLATVAAVSRSTDLASELTILVRRYRRDPEHKLSIEDAFRLCLISAASHTDPENWRQFVGERLTELALSDLESNEGDVLYSRLQRLIYVEPGLWVSCGRADAALMAYNASHPS